MNLGIRLHDIVGELTEKLEMARTYGFSCAHLALSKVGNYQGIGSLTPGYALYLKKMFASHNLEVAVLGCYLNLANPNPAAMKEIISAYQAHIRFASLLQAGVVGTETGCPNEMYSFDEQTHTEEALSYFTQNLKQVVRIAEKFGVILAIEPVYRHIVHDAKTARRVLDEINSSNLQIIFDPVNLLSVDNHQQREHIFAEFINLLADDIAVIHIKDYRVEGNEIISCACKTGMMDYTRIVNFIKQKKPYIHVTLEDTNAQNVVAAKEFLEELMAG
ncbi:sugar phosphate isomerase/epimerase [Clostridiales bacterium COT073_COT-073]|nr:sugar phosphate isomerase/epimerase [Clostridiales bacterium COT073_COT-073]